MATTTIPASVGRLRRPRARRGLPLSVLGPAFVAASVVAVFVQFQAAKLGIATGRSLPELCRERFPRWGNRVLWAQAEIVTDLAEFVGAAIGLKLGCRASPATSSWSGSSIAGSRFGCAGCALPLLLLA